ncbi:hypothetical protein HPHPH24C_1140 [Helicobacter pylori Hp H-24c]|uniref:hypothetical protein n=1 Tax=Helicobacter pylori TaxID=210 RepID=UPI00026B3BA9|nr:hypothetical protein [Helicobacter pylori]EJC16966.1 hypothetical protein HPHPH24B_1135 [Helicobacter pylori Hp H-24b]EJC18384.1 hypothetical protein HPHPH24C_1140 [Helicobacter pylori Hp H-24c]
MKIKLTLKTPLKTPYKGNKVTTTRALFTKKKTGFHRGLALNFRVLKTLFGIFRFFNVKSR